MKKHFKLVLSLLFLVALLILPYFVFATSSSTLDTLSSVAKDGGYQESVAPGELLPTAVGIIIGAALSLLGAIFIILIIIGGYLWMTAGGNEQKTEKAQNYIRRAITGLIITLASWAIWSFLIKKLVLG